MKALQTRSPIHLYYQLTDLTKVVVNIYLDKDPSNFDTTTTPQYNLQSDSINNESIFEISDLLRSANQYEYEKDFYQKRDTAIYVLCKADLFDDDDNPIEVRHNFLRIRDGYVERQHQSQILNNTIPSDITEWTPFDSTIITDDFADPFGGTNAYKAADGSDDSLRTGFNKLDNINTIGVYTFSTWLKKVTNNRYTIGFIGDEESLNFNFDTEEIYALGNTIIAFDVYELNGWYKISLSRFLTGEGIGNIGQGVGIISQDAAQNEEVLIFNPTLIKGNYINQEAKDLILQDNFTSYSNLDISPRIAFDRKKANTVYNYFANISSQFENFAERQSLSLPAASFNLRFDRMDGTTTLQETKKIVLYECKYEPVKVTFLNRFGVLQDLVFFKKRVDSSSTDSESYKANVITNGEVYSHLGQRRVYNKQAEAKVKLSSGFYPENFNTVFKQLIFSEMVFIDDEPAVISTSTFRQKTQIDDKLINYDIDFDFANDDINSIR